MPYKASARPFFFPAAGDVPLSPHFIRRCFPCFSGAQPCRRTTIHSGHETGGIRVRRSDCGNPSAARTSNTGPFPRAHRRRYIVTSPRSGSPTIVSDDHSLQIRTVSPGQESETTVRNDFYGYIPSPKPHKGSLVHEAGIGIIAVLIRDREEATKAIYPRCRIATKSTPQKRKSGAAPVRTHSQPGPGRQRQVGKFGKTQACRNTEPMTEIISATVCINPDIFVIL